MQAISSTELARVTGGMANVGGSTGSTFYDGYYDFGGGGGGWFDWGEYGSANDPMVGVEGGNMAVVTITAPHELTAFDGALIGAVARSAGVATTAFIDGALVGAEMGSAGGPWGIVGGLVIGGAVGLGATMLLKQP